MAKTITDVQGAPSDPFFSESNLTYLREGIAELDAGRGVHKTIDELECLLHEQPLDERVCEDLLFAKQDREKDYEGRSGEEILFEMDKIISASELQQNFEEEMEHHS